MAALLTSHSFLVHLLGLFGVVGAGMAVPNSPSVSIAVALMTGISQAAHAYQTVRTQATVTLPDTGIRMTPPPVPKLEGPTH